ncbi:heterocyst-inhibiting protein PatX [Calothrix sp. NIES-3974]|uniref:heterocyst-inhibiting protein PatX n=1 Tax=Calothrix sp. NIES-3974 TaxID=2005462 RepID=UPI000B609AC0|nr:hypothetical protein [Calothrix sp. NIES-3974]BAZ05305.1 hypothetical protein NIES3974_19520 [Calothrix sp. NIES-3974]
MRVAISLLVSTIIFGAFVSNADSASQFGSRIQGNTVAKASVSKGSKRPTNPTPHRGSGRREVMQYGNGGLYTV